MSRAILDLKANRAKQIAEQTPLAFESSDKITILDTYFDFVCFHFVAPRYEDLVALKQDKEVKAYAHKFHKVMDSVADDPNPRESFMRVMASAHKHAGITEKVQGAFTASGRFCTWFGLIPIVGYPGSVAGASSDGLAKTSELIAKRQSWYLLGAKMSEALMDSRLSKISRDEGGR